MVNLINNKEAVFLPFSRSDCGKKKPTPAPMRSLPEAKNRIFFRKDYLKIMGNERAIHAFHVE